MPDSIPYLTVMYDQPERREFVKLFVYYYNCDWNLAQRKWSKILGAEYAYWQGALPAERVLSLVIEEQTVIYAAYYHDGRRYPSFWKRLVGRAAEIRRHP